MATRARGRAGIACPYLHSIAFHISIASMGKRFVAE
jgi:hypothetical protein